eukprot:3562581-Rhodomonas_salina.2
MAYVSPGHRLANVQDKGGLLPKRDAEPVTGIQQWQVSPGPCTLRDQRARYLPSEKSGSW